MRHTKEGLHRKKFSYFFSKILLKPHLKWEFNPSMHRNKAIFIQNQCTFCLFSKKTGDTSHRPLASCARKLMYFLKRGWYSTNFFNNNVQIEQNFTFHFKKHSYESLIYKSLIWLVADIMVWLIMTETDIEYGLTKTTVHARGFNKNFDVLWKS